MTPEARATVPAGIPGTPGIPDPAASPVPGRVVKPAPGNAATRVVDGASQPAGTDNGPIEFARPILTVIALGRPPRPGADAALFNWGSLTGAARRAPGRARQEPPLPWV